MLLRALAALAREDVPDEVANAYKVDRLSGRNYIIPTPFDPRLIYWIPPFVAEAAVKSGVAPNRSTISSTINSTWRAASMTASMLAADAAAIREPKRIVFAKARSLPIRAAHAFENQGLGKAILIAREDIAKQNMRELGLPDDAGNVRTGCPNTTGYQNFSTSDCNARGFAARCAAGQ